MRWQGTPASPAADAQPEGAGSDSAQSGSATAPSLAFTDIIQEFVSTALPSRTASGILQQGISPQFRGFQSSIRQSIAPASAGPVNDQKAGSEPTGAAPLPSGTSASRANSVGLLIKDPRQEVSALPAAVIAPPPLGKPAFVVPGSSSETPRAIVADAVSQPRISTVGSPTQTAGARTLTVAPAREQAVTKESSSRTNSPFGTGDPGSPPVKPRPDVTANSRETARANVADAVNRQAVNQQAVNRQAVNRQGGSAHSDADTESNIAAGSVTGITNAPTISFATADIEQPQAAAAVPKQDTRPRYPLTQFVAIADGQSQAASTTVGKENVTKGPTIPVPAISGAPDFGSTRAVPSTGEQRPDASAIPVEVTAPQPALKPGVSDSARSGGPQETQLRAQPAIPATFQPEAALTVVIRTGDRAPATTETGSGQRSSAVYIPSLQVQSVGERLPKSAPDAPAPALKSIEVPGKVANTGDSNGAEQPEDVVASAIQEPTSPGPEAAGFAIPVPANLPSPTTGTERVRAAAGTLAASSDTDVRGNPASQTASFQDLQVKADPVKVASDAPPGDDAPRPPERSAEPETTEKNVAQPLRSVALEFTPDGTRDVRVRLSERAGEVHVSLHSTDPSITKGLRDGVTDLASVLAHAGYDAKTWTPGGQPQDNPQPREAPAPRRRSTNSSAVAESFDGVLQHGVVQSGVLQSNQEIS